MKNIKKFIVIIAMTMIFSVSAFAASGFEFILNVPLGLGIGIPTKSEKDIKWKSGIGFDAGVSAQLGYMFQVKSGFGISVLGELGYAHTTRALTQKYEELGIKTSIYAAYIMDSFQIGLLPKINIGAFAIGIGGGVKIPVAFQLSSKAKIGDTTIKGMSHITQLNCNSNVKAYAAFKTSLFIRFWRNAYAQSEWHI